MTANSRKKIKGRDSSGESAKNLEKNPTKASPPEFENYTNLNIIIEKLDDIRPLNCEIISSEMLATELREIKSKINEIIERING